MIEIIDILKLVVIPLLAGYAVMVEQRLKRLAEKLENTMTKDEVKVAIELRQALIQQRVDDMKEDLNRIEQKLDKILSNMLS